MTAKRAPSLVASVRQAVAGMAWLKPTDQAVVDLALKYAAQIDKALASGDPIAATKALYLGPHLLKALQTLGGAPAERQALDIEGAANGTLAQLRALRGGAA